jgi:hypothetical protein
MAHKRQLSMFEPAIVQLHSVLSQQWQVLDSSFVVSGKSFLGGKRNIMSIHLERKI